MRFGDVAHSAAQVGPKTPSGSGGVMNGPCEHGRCQCRQAFNVPHTLPHSRKCGCPPKSYGPYESLDAMSHPDANGAPITRLRQGKGERASLRVVHRDHQGRSTAKHIKEGEGGGENQPQRVVLRNGSSRPHSWRLQEPQQRRLAHSPITYSVTPSRFTSAAAIAHPKRLRWSACTSTAGALEPLAAV